MAERPMAAAPDQPPARDEPITLTWSELRAAIAATWYPSMPGWDEAGQARIDRATDRLLAAAAEARR